MSDKATSLEVNTEKLGSVVSGKLSLRRETLKIMVRSGVRTGTATPSTIMSTVSPCNDNSAPILPILPPERPSVV